MMGTVILESKIYQVPLYDLDQKVEASKAMEMVMSFYNMTREDFIRKRNGQPYQEHFLVYYQIILDKNIDTKIIHIPVKRHYKAFALSLQRRHNNLMPYQKSYIKQIAFQAQKSHDPNHNRF